MPQITLCVGMHASTMSGIALTARRMVAATTRKPLPRRLHDSSQASTASRRLSLDEIVTYCKTRGFAYPGSGVYGSIGTGYDYGPLGTQLKKNISDSWWQDFIQKRADCVGIESSLILNPKVWEASGHVELFVDPLVECKACRTRVRADKLIKSTAQSLLKSKTRDIVTKAQQALDQLDAAGSDLARLDAIIQSLRIPCPHCGAVDNGFGQARMFNLLFETRVGPMMANESSGKAYLRPETAQGVYVNFMNVMNSSRKRLPLGIGQVGKSFRNEVAVGNFVFRTREFEQMELQYFCHPNQSIDKFHEWVAFCEEWLAQIGISKESVRRREYSKPELAHYAMATTDLEFKYPFGWEELWGIAHRGDFDLKAHAHGSGSPIEYRTPDEVYVPHAIEPAVGLNRLWLAVICDGVREEQLANNDKRLVFKLSERLAPLKAAVLPVVKSNADIMNYSTQLHQKLLQLMPVDFDETQSVGKRYRRQDEVGTPWCITVDSETISTNTVTLRHRDTMQQIRIHTQELEASALTSASGNKGTLEAFQTRFSPQKSASQASPLST